MSKSKNFLFNSLLFIIFLFLTIACEGDRHNQKDIVLVNLEKERDVGPFLRSLVPFSLIDSLETPLKGIPNSDSLVIQRLFLYSPKRLNYLYENDSISKKEYDNFATGVYAISGIEGDRQFFILDLNNDNDFTNDKRITFDKKISELTHNDVKLRDTFDLVNIRYNSFLRDSIIDVERSFRVFPYSDYFEFKNPNSKLLLYSRLQLVGEINEHWSGNYVEDSLDVKIAINSSPHIGNQIVISEDGSPFPETRNSQYFKHKVGDTLKLNKLYYRIDSLNLSKSLLVLKKLGDLRSYYGYLKDDKIKDLRFKDVNGNVLSVTQAFGDKPFLLLDFWGTWCGPCKELTPNLRELNQNNKNFNILSIAYEKKAGREKVLDYVLQNKMTWLQGYELSDSINKQTSFVHNLKVKTFPTFIILNRDLKISYRGFGKDALIESINFLESGGISN